MKFKTFSWPHNPYSYEILFKRQIAAHKFPFGGYKLQNLGMTNRIMRGEGEFSGKAAYDTFKKLASVFYENTPGTLVHPVWQAADAYFVSLSLKQEPKADYVRYGFEFWEDAARSSAQAAAAGITSAGTQAASETQAGGESWHTVKSGETLWGISARYGVTLASVIALNPSIKNPNLIFAGQKVRVR